MIQWLILKAYQPIYLYVEKFYFMLFIHIYIFYSVLRLVLTLSFGDPEYTNCISTEE